MIYERTYIEISNICNLQCHFCPEVIREKKILSVDDFYLIAKQIKPYTKQICLHLMGEPLAHPEFSKIANICDELNLKIFLTTNGTLLKKHYDTLMQWKSLEQVNFSVHSYFANPTKITLEEYLNPILKFCEDAHQKKNNFYINLRLWNLEKINLQRNQNQLVLNLVNNYFKTSISENVDIKLNKSKKIHDKLYLHFDTEFIWPSLSQKFRSTTGTCYGLRKQLAIHANGDVVPCCLDKEAILKIGNIFQMSLETILESERAVKIKTGFENNCLTEDLCQKCQYADRFKK